jgi:hypothetical protein
LINFKNIYIISLFYSYAGLAIKKGSHATPLIAKLIQRGVEAGLAEKWKFEIIPLEYLLQSDMEKTQLRALNMENFFTIFVFLVFGLICSLIFFIKELTFH